MLEQLLHISTWNLAIIATVIYGVWTIFRRRKEERQIQALGGHAPVYKTYLPAGK